ncbi:hypothetical protein Bca101_078649 [Brassica carinata]
MSHWSRSAAGSFRIPESANKKVRMRSCVEWEKTQFTLALKIYLIRDYNLFLYLSLSLSLFFLHGGNTPLKHRLKRAFVSAAYVIEKDPTFLEFDTLLSLLQSMKLARAAFPALALVECMFKNRKAGLSTDEKLDYMKPDLPACNAALEACCRQMESLSDAESVIESMSVIGFLGYLYARKGLKEKINELESLMDGKFKEGKTKLDHALADAFLNALVKGGFFGTAMQVVEKCREMKVFVDKCIVVEGLCCVYASDVPGEISKLINMQRLLIADNLIERLPGNLGKLQSLKVLILDGNRISCLPDELGQLIRLEQLSISRNMLIYLPDTIGSLRNVPSVVECLE